MNELSLFSGAGGGLLGTKLLGFKHIGYVEYNDYCQRIIKQRIKDGIFDEAPIFGDIRSFISEGYADSYKGMVDVITAGFPCQPFSIAGKQQGAQDDRNMWPQTIDVIRRVQPRFAFLENVPGLLSHEYARRIFGDLAESGFNAKWRVLSAAEVGAPHKRDRIFILCTNTNKGTNGQQYQHEKERNNGKGKDTKLAYTTSKCGDEFNNNGKDSAGEIQQSGVTSSQNNVSNTESIYAQRQYDRQREREFRRGGWWEVEPNVGRVVDGCPDRVDRLKALGNMQVPEVVRTAWELLIND